PVGELAGGRVLPRVAEVLASGRAVPARAARRYERADQVIPGLDPGHARTDRVDDSGALVAADDREAHACVALLDVVVGVAAPGRVDLAPARVGLRLVEPGVGAPPRPARRAAARGAGGHAHEAPLLGGAGSGPPPGLVHDDASPMMPAIPLFASRK